MMVAVAAAMAHLTEGNLLQLKDQPKVGCCLALITHSWNDRFGYDYDREMGGRPGGYGDDRPHGRFMGRHQGETISISSILHLIFLFNSDYRCK